MTTLLKPSRIVVLEEKHKDELEEDVSDRIWSLLGQTVHGILERAGGEGVLEQRHTTTIEGKVISGAIDLYVNGLVQDYKLLTVWKIKNNQAPIEYERQLNCYAYLLKCNGFKVDKLELVCILRDWSKMEARRNPSYPQNQVVIVPVKLWTLGEQLEFLVQRIRSHEAAKITLPECTDEETWNSGDTYAVMKRGRKSAIRLLPDQELAQDLADSLGAGHSVVHRKGEPKRCFSYCSVAKHCSQFQKWKKDNPNE